MKKLLFLCMAIVALEAWASAQNTFPHKWNIGESMGMGFSDASSDAGLLGFDVTFSHNIGETRWRWGTAVGMLLPAVMDYEIDETATEEEFLFSGYMYLLGYADYALSAGEKSAFYLHGGLAPCWQNDKWTRHNEKKVSALMQLGVGMDFGYVRMAFTGYASIHGDLGAFLSLGLYFGKKQNPNNN